MPDPTAGEPDSILGKVLGAGEAFADAVGSAIAPPKGATRHRTPQQEQRPEVTLPPLGPAAAGGAGGGTPAAAASPDRATIEMPAAAPHDQPSESSEQPEGDAQTAPHAAETDPASSGQETEAAAPAAKPTPPSPKPSRGTIDLPTPGDSSPTHSGQPGAYVPPPDLGTERVHQYAGAVRGMPEVVSQPPDIELDGADLSTLRVRAASLRGSDHRFNTETRQDSVRVRQLTNKDRHRMLLACVSDGVGSQPMSHLGSRQICDQLGDVLGADRAVDLVRSDDEGKISKICTDVVKSLAESVMKLAKEARDPKRQPKEYSATLVAAVVEDLAPDQGREGRRVVVFAVGDSCAYVLRREGGFEDVHDPKEPSGGVADTGTNALPANYDSVAIYRLWLAPGDMLLICSDGLANPMRNNDAVSKPLADWWRAAEPPTVLEFGWQLSFRAKSHGDDRSAVCIWVR